MTDNKIFFSGIASYILMAAGLLLALSHGLLAALLAGLLVYSLVTILSPRIGFKLSNDKARLIVVGVIGFVVVASLVIIIWSGISFFKSDSGNAEVLLQKLADIIDSSRSQCPTWICANIPDSTLELRGTLTSWLRDHASEAKLLGADAGHTFIRIIIGMIIGAMISLQKLPARLGCFGVELLNRISLFADSFKKIVFAQVKISSINTIATAVYILIILPLAGIHLPLAKTLIALTFVLGMMPIIGNLLSNTMLVIITLPFGLAAASISLLFLIVLHKAEYFLNAKIIGNQINASAWELLIAAIVMESIFGLEGVVLAPILYAYIKQEFVNKELI